MHLSQSSPKATANDATTTSSFLTSSGEEADSSESIEPSRSWYKDKVSSLEKEILKIRSRLARKVDSQNEKRAAVVVPIEVGGGTPAGTNRSAQSSAETQQEHLQVKARAPRGLEAKNIENDALPSPMQPQAHLQSQQNVKRASIYIAVGKDATKQKTLATMLSAMTSDLRGLITLEIQPAKKQKV